MFVLHNHLIYLETMYFDDRCQVIIGQLFFAYLDTLEETLFVYYIKAVNLESFIQF